MAVAVGGLAAVALRDAGEMNIRRIFRHLLTLPISVRWTFPAAAMTAIESAIEQGEVSHRGEIRFAVEAALDVHPLLRNQSARERAVEVFSELRVWDTQENCGVLIYLLLADRDVEILADQGIADKVGQAEWEAICHRMEVEFHAGSFEAGVLDGVQAVSSLLARHFPAAGENPDELPNAPVVL